MAISPQMTPSHTFGRLTPSPSNVDLIIKIKMLLWSIHITKLISETTMIWTFQIMIQCWFYNVVDMIYVYFAGNRWSCMHLDSIQPRFRSSLLMLLFTIVVLHIFCFVFVVLFMMCVFFVCLFVLVVVLRYCWKQTKFMHPYFCGPPSSPASQILGLNANIACTNFILHHRHHTKSKHVCGMCFVTIVGKRRAFCIYRNLYILLFGCMSSPSKHS